MIKSLQCLKCRSKYRTSYQGKKPVCAACRKHFENGVESTVENKIKNSSEEQDDWGNLDN